MSFIHAIGLTNNL